MKCVSWEVNQCEWQTCLSKLEKSRETGLNLTYSGLHVDGLYRANDEKRCHHY